MVMLLWLYGSLTAASAVIAFVWARVVRVFVQEPSDQPLAWSKRFWVAVSLTVHAAAMAIACGYRTYDALGHMGAEGSSPSFLILVLCMLLLSNIGFVWAGAVDERLRTITWPWWAFLYVLILWGIFCLTWLAVP